MNRYSILKKMSMGVLAAICIIPFAILFLFSVFSENKLSLLQYLTALLQTPAFMKGFWNSVLYTFVIIVFNIPISLLAGYAFAFFRFRGQKVTLWLYIVLMLMPFQAMVVPQYLTLKTMGVLNTPFAVILPNIFFTLGTFLMAQYMQTVDDEVIEAGKIDGLSSLGMFFRLVLPISKNGVYTLVILTFINYWSMVEQPLLFLGNQSQMPLSVLLGGGYGILQHISHAGGVLFAILPILLYLMFYQELVTGIGVSAFAIQAKQKQTKPKLKKKVGKIAVAFICFMYTCTFITIQADHLLVIEVDMARKESRQIASPKGEKVMFPTVFPIECLRYEEGKAYLYSLSQNRTDIKEDTVRKTEVSVVAQDEVYAAVQSSNKIPYDVVRYSTRLLTAGAKVRILE